MVETQAMDKAEIMQCMNAAECRLTEMMAFLTEDMKYVRGILEAYNSKGSLFLQDDGYGPKDLATTHRMGMRANRQFRRDALWCKASRSLSKSCSGLRKDRFSTIRFGWCMHQMVSALTSFR